MKLVQKFSLANATIASAFGCLSQPFEYLFDLFVRYQHLTPGFLTPELLPIPCFGFGSR